ncbi:hypothetical protein [Actinomadura sp. 9N407]|uniref:hypothetical protein n=1 Tax=Actinomadura sp. 9N407 TaxID=3375154 RepID=UPI00378A7ED4
MSLISVGSDEWFRAWNPQQRVATVKMARRRARWSLVWLVCAFVAVVVALLAFFFGDPSDEDLPSMRLAPVLGALSFNILVCAVNRRGWRLVERVFAEEESPVVLRSVRVPSAVLSLLACLASAVVAGSAGVPPALALWTGQFSWTFACTGFAVVVMFGSGISVLRLWVNLLPVGRVALDEEAS